MLSVSGPIRKGGGGGGGGGAVGFWPDTKSGGRSPGYSTVVEFMRTGINRQRKRAAIIIKCGPKSYEIINGGGGGHVPRVPSPLDPQLNIVARRSRFQSISSRQGSLPIRQRAGRFKPLSGTLTVNI